MDATTIVFDHNGSEYLDRDAAAATLREIREESGPVVWNDAHGGFWVVLGHVEGKRVMSDYEYFSLARTEDGGGGVLIPPSGLRFPILESDPPAHTVLRKSLVDLFSNKGIARVTPLIENTVDAYVQRLVNAGEFDFAWFARVVPPSVIIDMLGLPLDEQRRETYVDTLMAGVVAELTGAPPEAYAEVWEELVGFASQKRQTRDESVMSHLIGYSDGMFTDEEVAEIIRFLITAGYDTTRALIGHTLVYLYRDQDLRSRLIAEPDLIPGATEDILRYVSIGGGVGRTVVKDVELGGQLLKKGDRVHANHLAISRDPDLFDNPDVVDPRRANASQHPNFGHGVHKCLGIWLARREINYVVRRILEVMPDYTIDLDDLEMDAQLPLVAAYDRIPARSNP